MAHGLRATPRPQIKNAPPRQLSRPLSPRESYPLPAASFRKTAGISPIKGGAKIFTIHGASRSLKTGLIMSGLIKRNAARKKIKKKDDD